MTKAVENVPLEEPVFVYHGTTRREWKQRYDEPTFLYVTTDFDEAQRYADHASEVARLIGFRDRGAVFCARLADLPLERHPDHGGHGIAKTTPWYVSLQQYGTFALYGKIDDYKHVFRIVRTAVRADTLTTHE